MKILTLQQNKFLDNFFRTHLELDFFLTGGTALAEFYLHHRKSEDIDLFTVNQDIEFDGVNMEILKIIHQFSAKIEKQVVTPTFLQYILKIKNSNLKVDIVKDVPIHFGKIKRFKNIQIEKIERFPRTFRKFDRKRMVRFYLDLSDRLFKKIKPV